MIRPKSISIGTFVLFISLSPYIANANGPASAIKTMQPQESTNKEQNVMVIASSSSAINKNNDSLTEGTRANQNTQFAEQTASPESSGLFKVLSVISFLASLLLIGYFFLRVLPKVRILEERLNKLVKDPKTLNELNKTNLLKDDKKLMKLTSEFEVLKVQVEHNKSNLKKVAENLKILITRENERIHSLNSSQNLNTSLSVTEIPINKLEKIVSKQDEKLNNDDQFNNSSEIKKVFYYKKVNDNHNFYTFESSDESENTSLFRVCLLNNNEWIFDVVENPQVLPIVLRNIDDILGNVCDFENYASNSAKTIKNIMPGKLQLNGDELVVTKKAIVKLI